MSETELRELIRNAEEALDRLVAKRARATLKEAKRMAAEVGFELTFTKIGKPGKGKAKPEPQASRSKVLPKYMVSMFVMLTSMVPFLRHSVCDRCRLSPSGSQCQNMGVGEWWRQ